MSDFDAFSRILHARHSCRGFLDTPVPRAEIEAILRAAQRVPSWCNAQPWQVEITQPDETRRLGAALTDHAANNPPQPDLPWPERYSGAHQERRRTCGWQLYDAVGVTRGDREGSAREMTRNFDFFGAPHIALITSGAELGAYGAMDTGGFVAAFCLAAQARGLGSVPQAAPAAYGPFLRDWFGLGDDRLILATIAFGSKDPDHPANAFRTERAPLGEWVHWRDG
ncbi:MAG: nitroreductase [Rhodobacterales bacterium]|nr:MAG: nitroreductase [Rhodobacterales bacterium]